MSVHAVRRLIREGVPASWSTPQVERFATELYARAVEAERVRRIHPGRVDLMARRRALAKMTFAAEARERALLPIRARLEELEDRRGCVAGSWTPRAELARELGVSSVRLGRWLERGRVPLENMPDVLAWAQARIDEQLLRAEKQAGIERLIALAKRPGYEHTFGRGDAKPAARAPDLHDQQYEIDNRDVRGFMWEKRAEAFSTMALIGDLERWALGVRVPSHVHLGRARNWVVTALCSIYKRRQGGRSPGPQRHFGAQQDPHNFSRDLQIGAAVSSTTIRRGGLGRAVRLWKAEMIAEHCESEIVFVHGLIIRHWRRRSDGERRAFERRERNEWRDKQRALAAQRHGKNRRVRKQARKQALGRKRRPGRK